MAYQCLYRIRVTDFSSHQVRYAFGEKLCCTTQVDSKKTRCVSSQPYCALRTDKKVSVALFFLHIHDTKLIHRVKEISPIFQSTQDFSQS